MSKLREVENNKYKLGSRYFKNQKELSKYLGITPNTFCNRLSTNGGDVDMTIQQSLGYKYLRDAKIEIGCVTYNNAEVASKLNMTVASLNEYIHEKGAKVASSMILESYDNSTILDITNDGTHLHSLVRLSEYYDIDIITLCEKYWEFNRDIRTIITNIDKLRKGQYLVDGIVFRTLEDVAKYSNTYVKKLRDSLKYNDGDIQKAVDYVRKPKYNIGGNGFNSLAEVAKYLGVSRSTLMDYVNMHGFDKGVNRIQNKIKCEEVEEEE